MKKYLHPRHFLYMLLFLAGCAVFKTYTKDEKIQTNGLAFRKLAPVSPAGTAPGEFMVDPNGSASYTLSIDVPPGTNEVAPELNLVYSSQGGNGPLGAGWLIDGIISIQRVGKTVFRDGQKGGVNLDKEDRFAVNGQRLIAYRDKNGKLLTTIEERNLAYGADGTEYRTEIESWTRFYSYGNCGGGPCYFIAYSKDGSVSEFGTSGNASNAAGNGVIIEWAVAKVTDNNGNYITVNYQTDQNNHWHYLTSIEYTGNTGGNLAPQRMVEFTYQPRQDSILSYIGGNLVNINKRIQSIQTYLDQDGDGREVGVSANLLYKYNFTYTASQSTGESLISQIQQCDAAGHCLSPTLITYGRDRSLTDLFKTTTYASGLPLDPVNANLLPGDFNGDGYTDFIRQSDEGATKSIWVYLANGQGSFVSSVYNSPENMDVTSAEILLGDFNGDGRTDFMRQPKDRYTGTISLYFSSGNGSFTSTSYTSTKNLDITSANLIPGDFNGDGRIDFLRQTKESYTGNFEIYYYDPASVFIPVSYTGTSPLDYASAILIPGDFNGDGISDLLTQEKLVPSNQIQIYWFDSDHKLRNTVTQGNTGYPLDIDHANIISGDFNGDGKTDFVRQSREGTTKVIQVYFSAGEGAFAVRSVTLPDNSDYISAQFITGDFNGDGLTDILRQSNEGATKAFVVYFSQSGTSFNRFEYNGIQNTDATYAYLYTGDFNGDGTTDFFIQDRLIPSVKSLNIYTSRSAAPVLATSVQDGLGQYTAIEYAPLTNDSVYRRGTAAEYPYMDMEGALWVTVRHTVADKVQNPSFRYEYLYKYEDGQVNIQQGWLGFRKTSVEDLQHNSLTHITRNNRFPFMGTVIQEKVTDNQDTSIVLGITDMSYKSAAILPQAVYSVNNHTNTIRHYTQGIYNYSLKKIFYHDSLGMNLLRMDNLADESDPEDDLYIFIKYDQYPEDSTQWWKACYPVAQKTCNSPSGGDSWSSWDEGKDLEWKRYEYDSRMNQTASEVFVNTSGGTAPELNTWQRTASIYDAFGNVTGSIALDSMTWYTGYDPVYHTFPVRLVSPKPADDKEALQTEAVYDPRFGLKVADTDENGNTVFNIPDMGIDGLGTVLITQTIAPDSDELVTYTDSKFDKTSGGGLSVQTYVRKSWGQNDTSQWLWNKEYLDALGRQFQTVQKGYRNGTLLISKSSFNASGLVDKVYLPYFQESANAFRYSQEGATYASPVYVEYQYDRHGRPSKEYNPDPASPSGHFLIKDIEYLLHDSRKIVYTTTHPDSSGQYVKWVFFVNSRGQTISKSGPYNTNLEVLPETDTTTYTYDRLGNLLSITDPLGVVSRFRYNSVNELIEKTNPETGACFYQYKNSLPVWEQDGKQQVTTYGYDRLDRLVRKVYYDNTGNLLETNTYEYDLPEMDNSKGKLSRVTMPAGVYEYAYDNAGLLKELRVSVNGLDYNGDSVPDVYVTRYAYDPMGRISKITHPDRSEVNYDYDRYDGLLSAVKEGNDSLAFFDNYTSSGIEGIINYQNGIVSDYRYDFLGRLDSFTTNRSAFLYHKFAYRWNNANNLKSVADLRPEQFTEGDNLSEAFSYDNAGRLKLANGSYNFNLTNPRVTCSYTYDEAGNRRGFTEQAGQDRISSYSITYHKQNRNQISEIAYNNGSTAQYQYDANGNVNRIQLDTTVLEYRFGPENRLNSVRFQSEDIAIDTFAYDAGGDRVLKNSGDSVTYYITPLYEVTWVKSTNSYVHTRYVGGPKGVIQAKSQAGSSVGLLTTEKGWMDTWLPRFWDDMDSGSLLYAVSISLFIFYTLIFVVFLLWGARNWWYLLRRTGRLTTRGGIMQMKAALFSLATFSISGWKDKCISGLFLWIILVTQAIPVHGQTQPGNEAESGSAVFFTYDQIGSNILATNQAGSQSTTIVYKPFGSIAEEKGRDDFRPKYTGKELDRRSGLYYFGARYFDSGHGHFISPDPAMQYSSPYMYGYNNPMSGVDPNGEAFVLIAVLVVAGIIGAYAGASIANGTANPARWDWASGKTWVGIVGGAAVGVAVAAGAVAGLAALGVVTAEATTIGGFSAGSIALAATDVAFLTYDAFEFALKPNVENGIYLALDLIPFVGPLLGRGVHAIRGASKGAELSRGGRVAGNTEEVLTKESREIIHEVCPLSFIKGTEILTSKGMKEIQNLEVGDEIWSYDEVTGDKVIQPVSMLFSREAEGVVMIQLEHDTIGATPEHPFYVRDKGWVDAGALRPGDEIIGNSDQAEKILSAEYIAGPVKVYNVSITGTHTYYVSQDSLLSHNPHSACLKAKGKRRPGWRKTSKNEVFGRQTIKKGTNKGMVKSAVSNKMYLGTHKISVGSNGRKRIIWDIDHIVPYRYLLSESSKAKSVVTWKIMRNVSNDPKNLRLLTMSENVSHKFELTGSAARKGARKLLRQHGVTF